MHFDFHRYCKGDKYDSLKLMITKLDQALIDGNYFIEDIKARKV